MAHNSIPRSGALSGRPASRRRAGDPPDDHRLSLCLGRAAWLAARRHRCGLFRKASTNSRRASVDPVLVIDPCVFASPDWLSEGVSPSHAPSCGAFLKTAGARCSSATPKHQAVAEQGIARYSGRGGSQLCPVWNPDHRRFPAIVSSLHRCLIVLSLWRAPDGGTVPRGGDPRQSSRRKDDCIKTALTAPYSTVRRVRLPSRLD